MNARLAALRPWWPVGVVGLVVSLLVVVRIGGGLQPYGVEGAHYIEHAERLTVMGAWDRAGEPDGASLADELDGAFPPLLHLITLVFGVVVGHSAERAALTGLLWLWGLAAAVGWTAWILSRGDRLVAGAAACGALLLPAAHGFATRYYYDLPMTAALWAMVPVALATWDRRPVAGGLAVGGIWLAADLIKWSSLPFGAFLVVAAALTPFAADEALGIRWRRRAGALAIATGVSVGGSLAWIALAGSESSLGVMLDVMWAGLGSSSVGSGSVGGTLDGVGAWVRDKGVLLGSRFDPDKLVYYGVQGVASVFSPLLAVPALVLAIRGAIRVRAAAALAALSIAAQLAFLVLWIPVIDERFLLTSAPALLVLAGLGLQGARVGLPVVLAAAGLWVAVEFHTGWPILPSANWEATPGDTDWHAPPLHGWGIAAGDSIEQRGWSRAATTPGNREDARDAVWGFVAEARPEFVLIPLASAAAAPAGELYWLDYRSMLAARRDPDLMFDLDVDCGMLDEADVIVSGPGVEGACEPEGWTEVGFVQLDEGVDVRVLKRP